LVAGWLAARVVSGVAVMVVTGEERGEALVRGEVGWREGKRGLLNC
jgi:hypothetical protein